MPVMYHNVDANSAFIILILAAGIVICQTVLMYFLFRAVFEFGIWAFAKAKKLWNADKVREAKHQAWTGVIARKMAAPDDDDKKWLFNKDHDEWMKDPAYAEEFTRNLAALKANVKESVEAEPPEPPYNVIDGYILPTQEDTGNIYFDNQQPAHYWFWCKGSEFKVYEDDSAVFFNGAHVGDSDEYWNAIAEVYEEQSKAMLTRLARIDDELVQR